MTKFAKSLCLLGFTSGLISPFSTFAVTTKTAAQKKPAPVVVAQSDLLMDVDGQIFSKETFPESCKDFFLGAKCDAQSFGKYHLESKKDGDLVHHHVEFSGPEGVQVIEDSWEKDGKVKRAKIENRALQKSSELEVKNGKVFYQVTDLTDKKVKKSEDSAEDNLVVPSTIMTYIRPYSEKIAKGETVQIKIAVLDRMESFTFNIQKIKDEKSSSGEALQVLKMSPASFIVKAAVDPMFFHVKAKTGEMFAFEGESALRKKVGDSWKKMQVRTGYQYKTNLLLNESTGTAAADCDPMAAITGKSMPKCEVKKQ